MSKKDIRNMAEKAIKDTNLSDNAKKLYLYLLSCKKAKLTENELIRSVCENPENVSRKVKAFLIKLNIFETYKNEYNKIFAQ